MNPRGRGRNPNSVSRDTISRRTLLAVSGILAAGGLSGCLNRVASAVTNTGASPAAVFAGEGGNRSLSEPRVTRLTPTLSAEARGVSGEVDLEGWVTSSSVVAANYNNTRSNRSTIASPDSAVTDDELVRILAYLEDDAIVAERFTVCLPDAEVPGGNGSIADAVTPKRLIDYITGRTDTSDKLYSWGDIDSDGDGLGDCDDREESGSPENVCGETEHFAAAVSGPMTTGGSLQLLRGSEGEVLIVNSPLDAEGASMAWLSTEGGSDGPESSTEAVYQRRLADVAWRRLSDGGGKASPYIFDSLISQVMVKPPRCPHPFPALLYVGRAGSDDQLVYSGGWVIDDSALYEDSVTMLTMVSAAPVVGINLDDFDADSDGDSLGDAVEQAASIGGHRLIRRRRRRGARLDTGTTDSLTDGGVVSEGGKESYDNYVRKKPGRTADGGDFVVTHLALDAPILHLVNAGSASNDVKFKAGAELSKSVN